jgi:hypothetical protein
MICYEAAASIGICWLGRTVAESFYLARRREGAKKDRRQRFRRAITALSSRNLTGRFQSRRVDGLTMTRLDTHSGIARENRRYKASRLRGFARASKRTSRWRMMACYQAVECIGICWLGRTVAESFYLARRREGAKKDRRQRFLRGMTTLSSRNSSGRFESRRVDGLTMTRLDTQSGIARGRRRYKASRLRGFARASKRTSR